MSSALINPFAETVIVTRYEKSIQSAVFAFDQDFVADNFITLDLNGVSLPASSFQFNHAQTLLNLADVIASHAAVASAIVTGPLAITITAVDPGNELLLTNIRVTGGTVQPLGVVSLVSGGYVDGLYQPGGISTFAIRISLQPLQGKEILQFPEAQRTRRLMKGYTATPLRTAETAASQKADRLQYHDTSFEVQKVERWRETDLNHYKVLVAEVNA